MAETKDFPNRRAFHKISVCVLLLFGIVGVLWLTNYAFYLQNHSKNQKDLDDQIANVRSGQTKSIYLYCSFGTDALLEQLANVPEIEEIKLDLTDVSDDGMNSLIHLKGLKSLIVVGGRPGVIDQGFSSIKDISSLEHLELMNTRVTDRSLPLLKELPNLRSLTLCHSANFDTQFTASGLQDMKALTKLKKLYVSGGLASDAAVNELRKALSDCSINEKDDKQRK